MNKTNNIIFISFLVLFLIIFSCSSNNKDIKATSKKLNKINENKADSNLKDRLKLNKLLKKDSILLINKKNKLENIARFNYYSINNDLIFNLSKLFDRYSIKNEIVNNTMFSVETNEELQSLAALKGYKKALILDSDYKIKSNVNFLSITYLTIVGIFFFPGNSLSCNLDLKLSLIDVKTGSILYENNFKTSSHTYIHRLGNTQSVLKSAINEVNNGFINNFNIILDSKKDKPKG